MKKERPILKLKRRGPGTKAPTRRVVRRGAPVKQGSDADLLADLQAASPDVWNPARPAPLALGIHRQIFPMAEARAMSRSAVRRFLARWTATTAYLFAVSQPGSSRCDLDGSPAGEVTDQHRTRARQRLNRTREPAFVPGAADQGSAGSSAVVVDIGQR